MYKLFPDLEEELADKPRLAPPLFSYFPTNQLSSYG